MGFHSVSTEVLLQEHKHRPITGRALMIGRQNTILTEHEVRDLLSHHGIPVRDIAWEVDTTTIHQVGKAAHVTDRCFFAAFTDCTVEALDISDYEGAEIVHDMTTPLPAHLHGQFDLVFDGSSLDNIFDPALALMNMHRLLKPGGRLVLINFSNSHPTAYTKLSPDWYMDFFAFQEYADAQIFVSETDSGFFNRVWQYDPLVVYSGMEGYQCSSIESTAIQATICMAERGTAPTREGHPVQMHYRGEAKEPYLNSARRFHQSARRYDFSRLGPLTNTPSISTWGVLKLLADGFPPPPPPTPMRRLASAYLDGRLISGLRRRIGL